MSDIDKSIRAVKMDSLENYKPSLWSKFCDWVEETWPFNGGNYVASFEEYKNLPHADKTVWEIFYLEHYVCRENWIHDWGTKSYKKEDELIEAYKRERWPIQYYFRETLGFRWWRRHLKDFWYGQIKCRINPKQKWLTKIIPRTWSDKVWLIPEINFAMVVDFVDGEKCFDNTDYEGSSPNHAIFAKELKECYDYIKTVRPNLQKEFENSYPDNETRTGVYSIDYAEPDKIEKLLSESDTKWLVWIVTNRDYMWT